MKQVIVCLKVEYDDSEYHHPRDWDWASLLDLPNTKIISVYEVIKKDEEKKH